MTTKFKIMFKFKSRIEYRFLFYSKEFPVWCHMVVGKCSFGNSCPRFMAGLLLRNRLNHLLGVVTVGDPEIRQLWLSLAKNGLSDVVRIIASVLLGDPRLAILLVTAGI